MAITKRPAAANATAIEEFIDRAPDAGKGVASEPVKRRKETISLGLDPMLLEKTDRLANRLGLSRAGAIALALARLLELEEREARGG